MDGGVCKMLVSCLGVKFVYARKGVYDTYAGGYEGGECAVIFFIRCNCVGCNRL